MPVPGPGAPWNASSSAPRSRSPPRPDADPRRLRAWACGLSGSGPVPAVGETAAVTGELLGVAAESAAPHRPWWSRLGPLTPIALRTALGCAPAGYASLALGIGRPYWALVTAAAL